MNVIAPATPVDAEHQHDRPLQEGRHPERGVRKRGRRAEEGIADLTLAGDAAIGEDAHDIAPLKALHHRDHGVRLAQSDHIHHELGIDRVQH